MIQELSLYDNSAELDKYVLHYTATIDLIKSLEVNGRNENTLVGVIDHTNWKYVEIITTDGFRKTVYQITGWNFSPQQDVNKKRDNANYQYNKIFIPIENVESISMNRPSDKICVITFKGRN